DGTGPGGESDGLAVGHRLGDGEEAAHRGNPVVEGGAELRGAVEDDVGKPLDLPLEGEAVLPQEAAILAVLEALDLGPLEPRQRRLAEHAAVGTMNSEALFKIASARTDQRQVPHCSARKLNLDRPAMQ